MGQIIDQLVGMGFEGYAGWNDDNAALADYNATGGAGKTGGGGGTAPGTIPEFSFDQKAAEEKAMAELKPYYEKLLKIYNGDVAMAKKRMEQDYERGLRYKQEDTQTGLKDIESVRAERNRKLALALGDLDQEMNTRGLTNSGIKTTDTQNKNADEAYQQEILNKQGRDLVQSEKRYKEGADTEMDRFLVDKGFKDGGVDGFYNEGQKKAIELTQGYQQDVGTQVDNAFNKAITYYNVGTTPLATITPTNYGSILNNALEMSGLPKVS